MAKIKKFLNNISDSLKRPVAKKSMPALLLLIASLIIIWLSMNNFALNLELLAKNQSLIELNNAVLALNQANEEILEDFNNLSREHSLLKNNYSSMNDKFFELNNSFKDFEDALKFQLDFFRDNGNIANASEYSSIRKGLKKCYKYLGGGSYEINLACIPYMLKSAGLSYKEDSKNELLGIIDFYNNGGGDCEDWAMVFTASFNYLKSLIPHGSNLAFVSFHNFCDEFSEFFLTNDNDYYLDACPISFNNYSYAQSFCGARSGDDSGHCWVILTKEPINSSNDIEGAIL